MLPPDKRLRYEMHLADRAVLIDKQMTPAQMSARSRAQENLDRLHAMLAEEPDVERNLTGLKDCREQIRDALKETRWPSTQ